MIFVLFVPVVCYVVLLLWLLYGFFREEEFKASTVNTPTTKFSIIVPFRNEEKFLYNLLSSLAKLNYPSEFFEVLFVDDASKDNSKEIITGFFKDGSIVDYKILNNKRKTGSPKKDAINTAISISKFEWIITTDADCTLPENWLKTFDQFIRESDNNLIAAPVLVSDSKKGLLSAYQKMESLSLAGITIGSFGINKPIMCNGANLAYQKAGFKEVGGFDNNDHIASGDDVFLLEKFKSHFPGKVGFLKSKNALVLTTSENTWKDAINQRVRWASKSVAYRSLFSKFVGLCVFLVNMVVVLAVFSIFIYGNILFILSVIGIKYAIDLIFIYQINRFFKREMPFMETVFTMLFYPFLTFFIGIRALFGNYIWKGRNFQK